MSRAREQRRRARRDLHDDRAVPALYYATQAADPVAVTVRVHTKFDKVGALPGGGAANAYAERVERQPRLIFHRDDLAAQGLETVFPRALVSVEAGEAYRIVGSTVHDTTIAAEVTPILDADELAALNLAVPDEQ